MNCKVRERISSLTGCYLSKVIYYRVIHLSKNTKIKNSCVIAGCEFVSGVLNGGVIVKELAEESNYTFDDCCRLWKLNIREAMLIAAMCVKDQDATSDKLATWVENIATPDMAEQASFYLFKRIKDIDVFIEKVMSEEYAYGKSVAYFAAARTMQKGCISSQHRQRAERNCIRKRNDNGRGTWRITAPTPAGDCRQIYREDKRDSGKTRSVGSNEHETARIRGRNRD